MYYSLSIFQYDCMYALRRTSSVDDAVRDLVSLCKCQSLITYTAAQSSGLYRLDSPATASAGYYHASTRLNTLDELLRFFHECWDHPSADQMRRIVSGSLFTNIPPTLSCTIIRKYFYSALPVQSVISLRSLCLRTWMQLLLLREPLLNLISKVLFMAPMVK